jgi:phage/plasmid-like protein (TIGR03299 family)
MDWNIEASPVHYLTQIPNLDGTIGSNATNLPHTGKHPKRDIMLSFDEQKVLYRSDNQAPLSVVSQRFHVVQPREILEFYRDLTEKADFELETAGVLKGGKKLWALARTGQSASIKSKDVSNGYILLATACDGTMATTAQFTSIRVVCNNTLAIALKQGSSFNQGIVKVPHNTRFDAQAVKQQLGISISAWDEYIYQLNQLSNRKVKNAEVDRYLWQVFNDKVAPISSSFNERAMNKCKSLFEGHGRGAMLDSARGTAFGLLNSVTEFVDHERRAKSTDHRLESAWFGNGAVIKQRALDLAGLMVG